MEVYYVSIIKLIRYLYLSNLLVNLIILLVKQLLFPHPICDIDE
jgi:hypothetical protein